MNQVWRRCCLATIFAVRWFGFWNNKKNNNKTTKLHKKKFSSRKQQKCQKKEKTFRSAFNSKKSREPLSQNTKRINLLKTFCSSHPLFMACGLRYCQAALRALKWFYRTFLTPLTCEWKSWKVVSETQIIITIIYTFKDCSFACVSKQNT